MRELKETNIDGRVMVDLLQYIKNDFKLKQYSLNAVTWRFLNEHTEEIPTRTIQKLATTDEFSRRRLACYCVKDATIPLRLIAKLQIVYQMIETCRVCGIPVDFLFTRGQQIKVSSKIFRYCKELGFVVPMKSTYSFHSE